MVGGGGGALVVGGGGGAVVGGGGGALVIGGGVVVDEGGGETGTVVAVAGLATVVVVPSLVSGLATVVVVPSLISGSVDSPQAVATSPNARIRLAADFACQAWFRRLADLGSLPRGKRRCAS